jgi:small subunit ribosomal protein S1
MNNKMTQSNALKIEEEFSTGEDFAKLFEESTQEAVQEGSVVHGIVAAIDSDFAIIDVGVKTEGRVSLKEFMKDGKQQVLNIGDEVEVFLERLENRDGEAVVSREKALREASWKEFEKAHGEGSTVEGTIFGRVKGGFTVDLNGAIAFLPGSQVDVRPIKDISPLIGIKQPFQILKMDHKRGNIVVSRRAILEESRSAERDEVLAGINEGDIVEGIVKNITDYGAFIDLGAVDGLLHVTDISWRRVSHPSEVLKVGDTIKAKVIKLDDKKRISLGVKQMEDSPWSKIEDKYPLNSKAKGKVTNVTDYGAFIELEPGIEGLVHVSEMSWSKKNVHPNNILKQGDEVEVMLLDVDSVKHRISLGIKQCQENPWSDFSEKYPDGTIIKGEIKNIAEFGIFVEIKGANIDGLVHITDLCWEGDPEEKIKEYNKGDELEVIILGVDTDNERVSLGVKQLDEDPFLELIGGLKKGSVSTFEVCGVKEDGIEVKVAENITSFIRRNELAKDRVEQRPDRFAVGDRVDAKVSDIDKKTHKISLSIKALETQEHKKAIKEYGSTDSGASLGDILGVALDQSKEEKKEKKETKKPAAKKTTAKKKDEAKEDKADK